MKYKINRIKNHEEYMIDTNGIVYGKNGKPLKFSVNHRGYCIVNFYENHIRRGFQVHRLVAIAFIPNPKNKQTVNHIDGNKQNNNVENLEWATQKEQAYHSIHILGKINKTYTKQVVAINCKNKYDIIYFKSISSADRYCKKYFGLSSAKSSIWRVINHQRKVCCGYYWYYASEYNIIINGKNKAS